MELKDFPDTGGIDHVTICFKNADEATKLFPNVEPALEWGGSGLLQNSIDNSAVNPKHRIEACVPAATIDMIAESIKSDLYDLTMGEAYNDKPDGCESLAATYAGALISISEFADTE